MNKSCCEKFSDLIDTMIELEVGTGVKSISPHQNRMRNYELSGQMIIELIYMLLEKAEDVDELILKEAMTCERCISLQQKKKLQDQSTVNR